MNSTLSEVLFREYRPRKGTETFRSNAIYYSHNYLENIDPERGRKPSSEPGGYPTADDLENIDPERGRKQLLSLLCFPMYSYLENIDPERGRKLFKEDPTEKLNVFREYRPRKGTETCLVIVTTLYFYIFREYRPRKGTETIKRYIAV